MTKTSIIISTFSYGRLCDVLDLINGLMNQTDINIEIIVIVDENKKLFDELRQVVTTNIVKIVFNKNNLGLSYSRNIGIGLAKGDLIAFIDDDAVPNNRWVESIVGNFSSDESIGAVTGDVIPIWKDKINPWFPKELYWMISCSYVMTPKEKSETIRGFGTNMAFRKNVFKNLGDFNTNLGLNGLKWIGGEDTDMFIRVKQNGMKVVFDPNMMVFHKIPSSRLNSLNLFKRAFNGGLSVAAMKKIVNYKMGGSLEQEYIINLFLKFYPHNLSKIFFKRSLISFKQLLLVTLVVIFEFWGYTYGTLKYYIK